MSFNCVFVCLVNWIRKPNRSRWAARGLPEWHFKYWLNPTVYFLPFFFLWVWPRAILQEPDWIIHGSAHISISNEHVTLCVYLCVCVCVLALAPTRPSLRDPLQQSVRGGLKKKKLKYTQDEENNPYCRASQTRGERERKKNWRLHKKPPDDEAKCKTTVPSSLLCFCWSW